MLEINGTTIKLTRGDSAELTVQPLNADGTDYEPQEGDTCRFRLTRKWDDATALVERTVPTSTWLLKIVPEDTSSLGFKVYKYDVQLTTATGDVYTYILGEFEVTKETDDGAD